MQQDSEKAVEEGAQATTRKGDQIVLTQLCLKLRMSLTMKNTVLYRYFLNVLLGTE